MKKLCLIFVLLPLFSVGQQFTIKRITSGSVYQNGHELREKESFGTLTDLYASSTKVLMRVNDPKTGTLIIGFVSGKRTHTIINGKSLDLYQLFVKGYLDKYFTISNLAGKGNDDLNWFNSFVMAGSDSTSQQVFLMADDKAPLKTSDFHPNSPFSVFVHFERNGQIISRKIPIVADSLWFSRSVFDEPYAEGKISVAETDGSKMGTASFLMNKPVVFITLSRKEFRDWLANVSALLVDDHVPASDQVQKITDLVKCNFGYYFSNKISDEINNFVNKKQQK